MMTIARFADRTGIPPSALRFYESKGLLEPADRLDNGYRLYAEDQIATARLVTSLREAGVPIADIRRFLDAPDPALVERWRREAAARLLTVEVAARWLRRADEPDLHLYRWDEPACLVWLPARGAPGPLPFADAVPACRRRVERAGARVLDGGYVRTLDLADGLVHGEVGFRIAPRRRLPAGARVEDTAPTVFATLEVGVEDDRAAHRAFRYLDRLGLAPVAPHLERCLPGETHRYQLLFAVRPAKTRRPGSLG